MPTLSKEQAVALSNDLLAQERRSGSGPQSLFSRFSHPLNKFAELSGCEPRERNRLLRMASIKADKQISVLLSGFLFAVVIPAVAIFAPIERHGFAAFVGAFAFFGAQFVHIRRAAIRRCLLEALMQQSANRSRSLSA